MHRSPCHPDSPLWGVDRLWLTPHCAWQRPGEPKDLAELCIDNVGRFLRGESLRNPARSTL